MLLYGSWSRVGALRNDQQAVSQRVWLFLPSGTWWLLCLWGWCGTREWPSHGSSWLRGPADVKVLNWYLAILVISEYHFKPYMNIIEILTWTITSTSNGGNLLRYFSPQCSLLFLSHYSISTLLTFQTHDS